MFKSNRVFKQKEVVSNLHVCSNGLEKMWTSYTFQFLQEYLPPHIRKNLKFFSQNMSRYPTINILLPIMSKWLAKDISTKVSFKITIRKIHVYIDIVWPWIWKQCFYLGIWNDDRTEMIVLASFHFATRLNSETQM